MPTIANAHDGYSRTMSALKFLIGGQPDPEPLFMHYGMLGYHGYTISVSRSHIDYLNELNTVLAPDLPVFDSDAINRWRLINELLLAGFTSVPPDAPQLSSQFPALAALAAFPTLEEVARRASNRWNEEGQLLREVPLSDGVTTWTSDGLKEPKSYKAGQRIVFLSHKLQLMDLSLDPRLRKTIASLDTFLQRPMVDGMDQPMSPLYDRLQYFRDKWVHGRRFDGWEALLISLLLALIYFGTLRLRHLPSESLPQSPA